MTSPSRPQPPRLPRALLRAVLPPGSSGGAIVGDLEELWRGRRVAVGRVRAGAWYWWQAVTVAWSYRRRTATHGSIEATRDLAEGLRTTLRRLAQAPMFSLAVMGTLALGVGANAAVFSLVRGVLMEPLPYPDAGRIVFVSEDKDGIDVPPGWASVPNYLDWRERLSSFQALALFRGRSASITTDVIPEYAYGALVTPSFFDVFGTDPMLGRRFTPEETGPGDDGVVILGHGLWQRGFGGDEGLVGETVRVDGEPHVVVGVMPPGFEAHGDWVGLPVQLWRPFVITEDVLRQGRSFHVAGRLADGVELEAARGEMAAVQEDLIRVRPEENDGWRVWLGSYRDMIVGDIAASLWLLLATTALVLVVACINVAGLGLNRVFDRRVELATRRALGGSRRSVVALVLAESTVLALAGGAAGVALGQGLLAIVQTLEPGRIPRLATVQIDATAMLFSLALVLATALVFGGVAALAASRSAPGGLLREARAGGPRAGIMRSGLVTAQLVLSFALLLTSGLLLRSFFELRSTDLGFRPEGVTAATVALSWDRVGTLPERTRFTTQVLAALRALPGAGSVGMINSLPLSGSNTSCEVEIEGMAETEERPPVAVRGISPGYLETMGIPVVSGRGFEATDVDEPRTALVNRTMANRHWPDGDAPGRRVRGCGEEPWLTVVGVVGDVRHYGPDAPARPELYVPYPTEFLTSKTFVVRWEGSGVAGDGFIREAIADVDPDQPVREVRGMEEWAAQATSGLRFQAWTMTLAAALATALAAVGMFGVLAGLVRSRTRDLAVRMALGAPRRRVVSLVLHGAGKLVAFGVVGGLALAFAFDDILQGFLLGVSVHDPSVVAGCVLVFVLVGGVAALAPARRAISMDSARVLREE